MVNLARRVQEAWKDPGAADTTVLLLGDSRCVSPWVWSVVGGQCPPLPLGAHHSQCDCEPMLHHLTLLPHLPRTSPCSKIHPAPELPLEQPKHQSVTSPSSCTRWWYGANGISGRSECKPPCPICTPNCMATGSAEKGSEHYRF